MSKIRILSDNLANQIAAGEVVERPASVIKELLENALDAGAKRLQIDIELGGRRLMRIIDDGEGMNRDDAVLAFERHATSKIRKLEDLATIQTLGFRGEALASIASVAKVELITKTADTNTATRVLIEGGKLVDVKDFARNTGTTISVRDLFFNTPARRKFMRSESTENYHITSIITHYALANPEISFVFTNNGRENLRLSPAKNFRERAYQILGGNLLESLLEIEGGREFIAKISGYVSAPRERRTTRDSQYFFINGRFVKDKVIAGGLLEGYRSVLPHGVYPVAVLFLEIPPEEVDVNVHPSKTEVRFRRAEAIKDVIAEAVRKALANNGLVDLQKWEYGKFNNIETPSLKSEVLSLKSEEKSEEVKIQQFEQPKIEFQVESRESRVENLDVFVSKLEENNFEIPIVSTDFEQIAENRAENNVVQFQDQRPKFENAFVIENQKSKIENYKVISPFDSALKATKSIDINDLSLTNIRPIGQLHNSYIIAVDDEGLLLIDQHVAHERILFDKFRKKIGEKQVESQNLLLPETFDLSPAQVSAFDLVESELDSLGFGLMRLSGRTIAIKAVPIDLPAKEVRNLLSEILDTVDAEKRGFAIETIRDDIAATMACKAAVKVNMQLTPEKMQWMIDNLITNSAATTCPHGRPIVLRLTMRDIERSFHRT
ncbi:MAG: DNA mismatch repair endonuclease MutL [Pyrinomonadaceae bacterium]|nr:DNA mismatch repair endonuclease MutL [Pyrinomonadaceae bacterium]